MKKIYSWLIFFLLTFSSVFGQSKVYLANVEGDIDLGLSPYIKRIIQEAEANYADAIIFKINTFGGRVDAATQIKDAILNSKIPTIAFVDKRAISAGSLIALSCQKVYMVSGSSMGATTVVDQTGEKQSEKAQSYMRSEMRATAEKNGRPSKIAEGMVDERIVVEGLVDSTQLITLTAEEAVKYEMADYIAADLNEVLKNENLENAEVITLDTNVAEEIVRFLNNPIVSSLLIMIILVGMFTEVKTPGWGVPGTAAVIALVLFFGSSYIVDLASIIEILIFIVGLGLLIVEIFVIPGFGIFGILGIILMMASLFLGLISDFPMVDLEMISAAIIQFAGGLIASMVLIYIISKFLPKTRIWNNLILNTNIGGSSGYTSDESIKSLVGKSGIAYTDLRPSGTILVEDNRIDAVTEGEYILKGTKISVVKEGGSKVVVRAVE
ncbi:MAG: ATP-dependent Clp protease proteolytic subunit [Melioribacteraceae bacterium]|nr:ATP-dependent Clp protease proteolytic subunit [Melioribacteraceae bacterium]MCO6474398.1 nodulation protein NfeD [Melioribacteraceae bacterium]